MGFGVREGRATMAMVVGLFVAVAAVLSVVAVVAV